MKRIIIFYIAASTFITLLVFSILFYKERTCIIDAAYQLFSILKDDNYAIQANRFGAFFIQSFPLVGSKLGASIKTIAIMYSMSFVILPFIIFMIIHLVFKNYKVSTAYLLFVVIMTTHTFYWIQSELIQAIAFLFIIIALLDDQLNSIKEPPNYYWILICVLGFTVAFTHPLILFPVCFVLVYYYNRFQDKRKHVYSVGIIYFSFFIIKTLFFKSSYDSQAMEAVKNFTTLFPNYIYIKSNQNFLKYFLHDYYLVILLLCISLIYYFKQKDYKKLITILTFFLGYSLLMNVCYPNGADQFYLESQYLVLGFFVAICFGFDIINKIKSYYLQHLLISIICIISIIRIYNTHEIYTNRLNWNRYLLTSTENLKNKKLIIPSKKTHTYNLFMTWASPYEYWLLSTIENGVSRSIIIEEKPGEFDWALPSNNSFITRWGIFDYSSLDNKYFVFTDTTSYIKYTH